MKFLESAKAKFAATTCATFIVGAAGFLSDITSIFFEKEKPVVMQEHKLEPIQLSIPYQELSNPKLAKKYTGQEVEIDAIYIGQWNLEQVFGVALSEDVIAINHREESYKEYNSPLGSSDQIIPDFAVTAPIKNANEILSIKSHSQVKIKGIVNIVKSEFGHDTVILSASSITPVG